MIPYKLVKKTGRKGIVEFEGHTRKVDLSVVDAEPGNFVVLQEGFVIRVLKKQEAEEYFCFLSQYTKVPKPTPKNKGGNPHVPARP